MEDVDLLEKLQSYFDGTLQDQGEVTAFKYFEKVYELTKIEGITFESFLEQSNEYCKILLGESGSFIGGALAGKIWQLEKVNK